MDQDSKKFFEELAGLSNQSQIDENEPKAVKIQDEEVEEEEEVETKEEKKSKEKKSMTGRSKISDTEEKESASEIFEEGEGQLTIDVYQNPDEIIVESTIAGVKPEDLDIAITNEAVVIKGKREKQEEIKDEDYFYQECYWGKFSRSIILPQEIDADKAIASLKNGILTIKLPKLNRQKTKKLKVKFD